MSTKCRLSTAVQSPLFHSISITFVLITSFSPFHVCLNNYFRSKIYALFLLTPYFLSATQRCAQPNILIFDIPQTISLATDVTLSYTETHTRPKITTSNQFWSELVAPFSLVYIVSVEPFFYCVACTILYHLQS